VRTSEIRCPRCFQTALRVVGLHPHIRYKCDSCGAYWSECDLKFHGALQ